MSAVKTFFTTAMWRVGVFALAIGPVLATPAQAAPARRLPISRWPARTFSSFHGNVNVPAPDIWNPYIPGTFILQGMNQNLMEPLFMLNYETGDIDGWLASGVHGNAAQTEWTVTLKPGHRVERRLAVDL